MARRCVKIIEMIIGIISIIVGFFIGYIIRKQVAERKVSSAEQQARNIVLDAENKAVSLRKEVIVDAKDEVNRLKSEADKDIKERKNEIQRQERRLIQKEENIDRKLENIEKKEDRLSNRENQILTKEKDVTDLYDKQITELERISRYSMEEAKELLLSNIEKDVRHEAAVLIRDIEREAKDDGEKKAREIITNVIQRCAADHIAETTVSVVPLPNDEMKGRIIGREGRNIRTLETLTGIDLIIDDTPEAVVLSGFDPIRREVARIALEKLIVDGRIHPARIEEMVEKAEREVQTTIKEAGEQASFEVGIHNLHPELIKLLGRLKYRTSYGQNVLKHSLEVSHLAGLMATELGLDVKLAKRAGLLHDIGKAVDHEIEGTHVDIGMDLLKKYKENERVINGMASHHGDYEPASLEAVLIAAADALSAARPGARRETLETYIKRLQKLEEIANSVDGVEKSFAIQAGREIRIAVKPDESSDEDIVFIARNISKQVEDELEYPGQIKINVVREVRAIEYAK